MRDEGKIVSASQICRWYSIARSSFYYEPKISEPRPPKLDEALVEMIRSIIKEEPEFGVRRITAVLRHQLLLKVNRKKVRRIVRENGWQVRKKPQGQRPRAKGLRSQATRPNERWAIDATHIFCGRSGWCFLIAIIDCCDRTIVGWRLSKKGVSKVAAAALEDALRSRGIKPGEVELTIRSDNGLVFGAKPFVAVVNQYNLRQEYITPYCPEQNGMIERWFRSLKEECVWLHRFEDQDQAFKIIATWIDRYHTKRPHSALGYKTPAEFRMGLAA
jgi:putative transposase